MKMKTINYLTMAILALTVVASRLVLAQETKGSMGPDDCIIMEERDVTGHTNNGPTLAIALARARHTEQSQRLCKKSILFEKVIQMTMDGPLVLIFPTAPAGQNLSSASKYQFGGKDAANKIIMDFSQIDPSANPLTECALTIRASSNIVLQNIIVKAPPASGICVGSMDGQDVHGVELDNVTVDGAQGHGIIFRENGKQNIIRPNSAVLNTVDGDAIKILGTGPQNFNFIQATARSVTGTDEHGLSILEGSGANFQMLGIGSEKFVTSERDTRIRVDSVDEIGDVFKIRAWIVLASSDEAVCGAQSTPIATEVERIQIYRVEPNNPGFYKYIMPKTAQNNLGFDQKGSNQGRILFEIKKADVMGQDLIVLVPELQEHTVAGSSAIVRLRDEWSQCDGAGGGGGFGGGGQKQLWNQQHCIQTRDVGGKGTEPKGLDETYDSDGDGCFDIQEDTNGDCEYDAATDFSNWMEPDTDSDGILDCKEKKGIPITVLTELPILDRDKDGMLEGAATLAEARAEGVFCEEGIGRLTEDFPKTTVDPCDVDGDGKSNASDDDADNDGIKDYLEDRDRTLNPWKSFKLDSIEEVEGMVGTCSLSGDDYDKGIRWKVYRWRPGEAPKEHKFYIGDSETAENYEAEGYKLVALACKHESVDLTTDFNGSAEGTQTDPYDVDTDGDNFCDGSGEGCKGLEPDKCPATTKFDNKCSYECANSHEDLYRVRDRSLLQFDSTDINEPIGLADANGNGIKDINEMGDFRRLYEACDDLDGDGIPDCAERLATNCLDLTLTANSLNPHTVDTDGDGAPDGIDIDPFIANDSQEIDNSNRETLRPALKKAQVAILRCFVDRDQDLLTDCEEDLNRDDGWDRPAMDLETFQAAITPLWTVETDPLNPDSDFDGLDDVLERDVKTNPQNWDTDGDSLGDRLELKGNAPDSYNNLLAPTCGGIVRILPGTDMKNYSGLAIDNSALRLGTNPTDRDTDDDGIDDNVEVSCEFLSTKKEDGTNRLADGLPEIDLCSHPLSRDSDGDGLFDGVEYAKGTVGDMAGTAPDGAMQYFESSPCDKDTDGDKSPDSIDKCPTSIEAQCSVIGVDGPDTDGDGLSDAKELALANGDALRDSDGDGKPNINDPDSDNDDIWDGVEDYNKNGIIESSLGETDPRLPDTDGDGLDDGQELKLGTNPNKRDTDQDCIEDGVEVHFNEFSSFTGTDTNPLSPDTDGDGLCDGNNSQTNGGIAGDVTCIAGEDAGFVPGAVACNGGEPDKDAQGRFLETDPRIADTDHDGLRDDVEFCSGGFCSSLNVVGATSGAPKGCFSLAPSAPFEPSSMLYVYGLLLMLNRVITRRIRSKK